MLKGKSKNFIAVLKHLKNCPKEDRELCSLTTSEHILDARDITEMNEWVNEWATDLTETSG